MKNCVTCGEPILRSKTRRISYCSDECANEAKRKTAREYARTIDPKKRNKATKRSHAKLKVKVKDYLGGKCVYCGCSDYDALELNHINGGGGKEYNRKSSYALAREILKGERQDIELACIVCNALHNAVNVKGLHNGWTVLYGENSNTDRPMYRRFEQQPKTHDEKISSLKPKPILKVKPSTPTEVKQLSYNILYGDKKYMSETEEDTDI